MRDTKTVHRLLLLSLILTASGLTAAAQNNRLKVVTWNITGGTCGHAVNDMRPYANKLRAKNADVIALQEVHFDQAYRMASHLWDPQPFYVRFVWTKRCASGWVDFGNAIISRYPIKEEGVFLDGGFAVSPDPAAKARGELIKVAQGSVQLPNKQWVRIYSAHLTGVNGPPDNASTQAAQTLTHILITDQRMAGQPRAILMGDFNIRPSTGPCANPVAGYGSYGLLTHWWNIPQFTDAWTVKPPDPSDPCGFTISPSNVPNPHTRYDYIFLRNAGGFTVRKMEVIKNLPRLSNHFPVYAELAF